MWLPASKRKPSKWKSQYANAPESLLHQACDVQSVTLNHMGKHIVNVFA